VIGTTETPPEYPVSYAYNSLIPNTFNGRNGLPLTLGHLSAFTFEPAAGADFTGNGTYPNYVATWSAI